MLHLIQALAVLLIATSAADAQDGTAIDGRDPAPLPIAIEHRVPLKPTSWPWLAIGRVNIVSYRQRRHCTGTLVGARLVLTAAHCLFDARLETWVSAEQVHFVAGLDDEALAGHAAAEEIMFAPEFKIAWAAAANGKRLHTPIFAHDWALITLRTPLPIRPVPVRVIATADFASELVGKEVARAGYSEDRAFVPTVYRGCSVTVSDQQPGVMQNQCEAHRGDSGSPILLLHGDEAFIIGLSTGATETKLADGSIRTSTGVGPSAVSFVGAVTQVLAAEK